ncbi:CRISPR-associated protein Cas5, partial [Vibrio cholerae]|uniref:CRISPR-associated protein Cas5 n=1 Tax=Vibrio cholerae TaxID=666 RepID=UPI0018F0A9F1
MKNSISFRLWGRYALFTDPITKVGGEKCTYHIPTYEAIKGILKSIYWKPTLVWHVDRVRVIIPLRT